ncbi:MerR family DNA-binding transcriptional regulator [Candidatus Atribacteria bacterium HGW-Atribacteria-1]|nr:MAG: MerR family DNA-binding transcriptional regulator [Candidatus Atribacteria bacterium HGW-Atribacteria-1]
MNKKTSEKNEVLTIGELAEVSGTRLTTLKYYTELGILPFNQAEKRLTRKYTEDEALERLKKIKELKEKRLTIKEIVDHFNKSN